MTTSSAEKKQSRRNRNETDLRDIERRQARIRIHGTAREVGEVICLPDKL